MDHGNRPAPCCRVSCRNCSLDAANCTSATPVPVRDLNFVGDTVHAFIQLAECDAALGQVVHVGTGRPVTVGELAELSMKIVGRNVPIVCDPKRMRPAKSEVRTLLCDAAKAKRLMDWQPRVRLETGLEMTARFMRDHLALYRPEEYSR